jgi:hypothetical protein
MESMEKLRCSLALVGYLSAGINPVLAKKNFAKGNGRVPSELLLRPSTANDQDASLEYFR